jgi:broad specificity phosphatase PhoE
MKRRISGLRPGPQVDLTLLRHGQSAANESNEVSGQSATDLTEAGAGNVRELAQQLRERHFDLAFSPPLPRSTHTIDVLVEAGVHFEERLTDQRISERKLGSLEEGRWIYVPAYADGNMRWAPRGGETYQALTRRCLSYLLDLYELAVDVGSGMDVLICSSRGPLRVLDGILTDADDSRDVLATMFRNVETREYRFTSPAFPRFAQL